MTGRWTCGAAAAVLALGWAAAPGHLASQEPSRPAVVLPVDAELATIAAAPLGRRAVAAWERPDGGEVVLEVAERGVDGDWSEPVELGRLPAGRARDGSISVRLNVRGEAITVWRRRFPRDRIATAIRATDGRWSSLQTLATEPRLGIPTVALGLDGRAVVAWFDVTGGDRPSMVRAAVRPPGGRFGPVERAGLAAPGAGGEVLAAAAAAGPVVAWYDGQDLGAARRAGPGGWTTQTRRVPFGGWPLALAPDGTAHALFFVPRRGVARGVNASRGTVLATSARPGAGWTEPQALTGSLEVVGVEESFSLGLELAVDGEGTAYGAWVRFPRPPPDRTRFDVGQRGAAMLAVAQGGRWTRGRAVSPAGASVGDVGLAASPRAGALVAWREAVAGEGNDRARARTSTARRPFRLGPALPLLAPARGVSEFAGPEPSLGPDGTAIALLNTPNGDAIALRRPAAARWTTAVIEGSPTGLAAPVAAGDGVVLGLLRTPNDGERGSELQVVELLTPSG